MGLILDTLIPEVKPPGSPYPSGPGSVVRAAMDLLALLFPLLVTDADADALRSTAPDYLLSREAAREQLVAARTASVATGMDVDLLLSIAWHESRYVHQVVGPLGECGVMQPEPNTPCPSHSLVDGYMDGATHLAQWMDEAGEQGLLGYAGGWRAIRRCSEEGQVFIRPGVDGCKTPDVFRSRARMIRRARSRTPRASS